ncbi:MAG: hypothetical protein V4685_02080 [Bacteroidota bacterium]
MGIRWKIFRIANIIEIILTALILFLMLVVNKISFSNTEDIIGFIICSLVTGVVTWNCINNLLFLQPSSLDKITALPNKTKFWIISILFLLVCIFVICCVISAYLVLDNKQYPKNYVGILIMLGWLLFIGGNGVYIFIRQITLFSERRKQDWQQGNEIISEIGESLE